MTFRGFGCATRSPAFLVLLALLTVLGCGSSETKIPPGSTSGSGGSAGGGAGGGAACTPGDTKSCYSGPAGTEGVGVCVGGTTTCAEDGSGFGPCVGEVTPVPETCDTPEDDDCNGQVNEGGAGCACTPGEGEACYDGPDGTLGVGACTSGMRVCNDQGTGWGPCQGQVLPAPETCDTPEDDDCNGQTNEGGVGCTCPPSGTASCYDGPAGTEGVGACVSGTKTCDDQ